MPRSFLWLGLLVALLYIAASAGPALYDQNEAQYAGAVREMLDRPQDYVGSARGQLERGHWFVPTNDGIPRLQKPPLVYWLLMGSMRVFGVNEFAARLPNAVFSLLWFGAAFLLGRRIAGNALGPAAATILATMAGTFIFTHLIAPEPYLAAFLTLTFWCFLSACQQPDRAGRWMFAAWIFMGLGVFCKGLHGALYPLTVAGWLAWRRPETRPVWHQLLQPAGPLLVLAVIVPWYAAIEHRYPGFLYDQFVNEQLGHVFNRRFPRDNNPVPLPVFALEHLVFFLPWTFFIPAAIRARRAAPPSLGWDLLAAWFGVTALTLLFSSVQDYYLMTAWTPVALWLARAWTTTDPPPRWMRAGPGWCLAAIGLLAITAAIYLMIYTGEAASGNLAVHTNVRDTIMATLTGFSVHAWRQLLPLAWTTGAAFLAGGAAVVFLSARGRWHAVLPVTALTMMAVLACAARGMCILEDCFSLKQIALAANRCPGTVVCSGVPGDNPSVLFYLNREIYWVRAHPSLEFASRELGIGRALFLSEDDLALRWRSSGTVLLIAEKDEIPHWRDRLSLTPQQAQPIAESGTRVLLINRR